MYKRSQADLSTETSTNFINNVEREYKSTTAPGYFSGFSGYSTSHTRFMAAVEAAKNRTNGSADDRANTLMIETTIFLGWSENAGVNCGVGIPAKLRALVAGYQLSLKTQKETVIHYAQAKETALTDLQSKFDLKVGHLEQEKKSVATLTNLKNLAEADRDRFRADLAKAEAKVARLEPELRNKDAALTRLEAKEDEYKRESARQQGEVTRLQGELRTAKEAQARAENRNTQLGMFSTGATHLITSGIQGMTQLLQRIEGSQDSPEAKAAVLMYGISSVRLQLESGLDTANATAGNDTQDDPMQGHGLYPPPRRNSGGGFRPVSEPVPGCLIL